jgi:hypothetical protein
MTMMAHTLIRIHGDEDWEAWGNDWASHVDRVGGITELEGWIGPPAWLEVKGGERQLDWGAFLYEIANFADVKRLVSAPRHPDIAAQQHPLLELLSEDERYGVIYIECY